MTSFPPAVFEGVWSASPTPLDDKYKIDRPCIRRLVEHHLRLGIRGLFVAGTCGEGPWLPDSDRRLLTQLAVKESKGRLPIAVQVTDNSAPRIVDKIKQAREDGADYAVIAPPHFMMNVSPKTIRELYLEAIRKSTLPVILYHFGEGGKTPMPLNVIKELLQEKKVVAMKDSSNDPRYRQAAMAVRHQRNDLRVLNGAEFDCVEYIEAGYDGLMLGGAAFNGYLAQNIFDAVKEGNITGANKMQTRMNRIMFATYGGKKIQCWLAGEKYLLMQLGVFRTYQNHPRFELTESCRKAVDRLVERDQDVLLP